MIETRPYRLFWILMPIVCLTSLLFKDGFLDLQFHDTYFVFGSWNVGLFYGILLGLSGIFYWLMRHKKLIRWMTKIHVILLLIIPIVMLTSMQFSNQYAVTRDIESFQSLIKFWKFLLLLTVVANLLFFINLAIGLIHNAPKKRVL